VPFFFRSQWSSGVRSPVFFSAQGGYVQKLRLHICEPILAGDLRRDSHFLTCRGRYCICRQRGRFSCWSCSLCCCLRCKSFFPGVRPGVKGFGVRGVEDERQFDVLPGGGRFPTAFNLKKNNIFKDKRKLNLFDRARELLSRPASFGSSILTKKMFSKIHTVQEN
jgi:hypothetical protein